MSHLSRTPFALGLCVVLLAGLSGCKGGTGGSADGGNRPATNSTFCNQDNECQQDFRCDRELHRCVCTSDQSCPGALFCDAFTGQCVQSVPGCTSDGDCQDPSTQYCDLASRTCHTRKHFCEACSTDAECGTSTDKCVTDPNLGQKFCGKSCSTNADCPTDASCQSIGGVKTCWPTVATCNQLLGCNPDSGQSCSADSDCTQGTDQICDKTAGHCVARVPSCPYGMVCDQSTSQCTAACTTDNDCASDPKCQGGPCRCTDSQCVPIAVCKTNTDCASGKVCVITPGATTGECGPGCSADSDCPVGQVCNQSAGRGYCTAGCTTNADCPLESNCIASHCEATDTTGNVNYCQVTEVCQTCELCSADSNGRTQSCKPVGNTYCQTCSAPDNGCATVNANQYCCDTNFSAGTVTGILGQDCSGGRSCPKGFNCVDIATASGTVLAHNCFPSGTACQAPTCQ